MDSTAIDCQLDDLLAYLEWQLQQRGLSIALLRTSHLRSGTRHCQVTMALTAQ